MSSIQTKLLMSCEEINEASKSVQDIVEASERTYEEQIKSIANTLYEKRNTVDIVLLAGPSASGKTTTSMKMQGYLRKMGIQSLKVSLDDFFLNRDDMPKKADGTPDYESVYAVDIDAVHNFFSELISKKKTSMPTFDFYTGTRDKNNWVDVEVDDDSIIIVEGIHALNPIFSQIGDDDCFYRVYASVATCLTKDGKPFVEREDIRLIRRMIRDSAFRNSPIDKTLEMWTGVCEGQKLYITPYKNTADIKVNSFMPYELCIYHHYFTRLLENDSYHPKNAPIIERIKTILDAFDDMDNSVVPKDSLLKEFVG